MIELDQATAEYFEEFDHIKLPPTHAQMILMRFCIPPESIQGLLDAGYRVMLRKHIEAVYIFGRLDENQDFTQNASDRKLKPVHTAVDMHRYDTADAPNDSEDRKKLKEEWKRLHAIQDALLAHGEAPHPDDPTQRIPVPSKKKSRFSENDLDIVLSHIEPRLRGKAV